MSQTSIFNRNISPIIQGIMILGLIIGVQLIIRLLINPQDQFGRLDYWITSGAFLLFFAVVCSVFSFSSPNPMKYYGQAITSFLLVAILGGLSAYYFSDIALSEAGSFSWIYTVLAVIFVVFLTIVNLMRKIVEIAKKQDKRIRNEK